MTRVLALDLSLTSSGYAIDRKVGRLIPPGSASSGMPRIDWIMRRCVELAEEADVVVIEGYAMGTARMQSHAHATGELGGLVRWAMYRKQIPQVDIPPASLKQFATGKGNANKEMMLTEAVRRLEYPGASNDEADALWMRAMALQHYGSPIVKMPAANLAALNKIKWPVLA